MSRYYDFTTQWELAAPVEAVWDVIYDSLNWPHWWKAVKAVSILEAGEADGINELRHYVWQGLLPYQLQFSSRLLEKQTHRYLRGNAFGDLEGEGSWVFTQLDHITRLEYRWQVRTRKAWMNHFDVLLRPVFRYNHHLVMQWGAEGLARQLNARLISSKNY